MAINEQQSPLSEELINFYRDSFRLIQAADIPFLVGGGYAFREHSRIVRDTADVDVFCKPGDYPRILKMLEEHGYKSIVQDARWVAKTEKGEFHLDFLFNAPNGICAVDDFWFERKTPGKLLDMDVDYVGAEEMLWCKMYICDRYRYDGGDINHILLQCGQELDWKWLLHRMDQHWLLFFSHLTNFNFVYPSKRKIIPRWVMEELLDRFKNQMELPTPKDDICRGPLISQTQYEIDITQWGYKVLTYGTI